MRQRDALVARGIVYAEIQALSKGGGVVQQHGPVPTLTVPAIVDAYDLQWGDYPHGDRAEQLVRKALNQSAKAGIVRVVGKDGPWNVYAGTRQASLYDRGTEYNT